MPNEYSNFTQQETGSRTGGATKPKEGSGYEYNPATGTWVPTGQGGHQGSAPAAAEATPTYDARQWGGRGRSIGADGKPIAGTSAGEEDVNRYRGMAKPAHGTPIIDQTQSNETKAVQDRALGYLRGAATGEISRARTLGEVASRDALAGLRSTAANVRGGALARAAAARAANQGAGSVAARHRLATEAAAAAEQAQARGQYAGALVSARDQEFGLASSQAGLSLGQRSADDQREQFYEGLGWDTANTQLQSGLGISAADQAAAASARSAASADADRRAQQQQDMYTTVFGGGTGLAHGAAKVPGPKPPPDPYSDKRAKTNVGSLAALTKGVGKKGLDEAIGRRVVDDAQLRYGYLDEIANPAKPGESMFDYLDRETEGATPYERERPEPLRLSTAPEGYAAGRAGQPGYMFAPPPSAAKDPARAKRDDEVILSDDRTKLAKAWEEGHAAAIADVEKVARWSPEDIKRRSEGDEYTPAAATVRTISAKAWDEGQRTGLDDAKRKSEREKVDAYWKSLGADKLAAEQDARVEAMVQKNREPAQKPTAPPPPAKDERPLAPASAPVAETPFWRSLATRARMLSDERAKNADGGAEAMAGANRAMRPSVYEYKPEFAGRAGQAPGEKNVGPMAQNMAKDPVARVAVEKQPDGLLAIDRDKGLKLVMGSVASLQEQVDNLKKRAS